MKTLKKIILIMFAVFCIFRTIKTSTSDQEHPTICNNPAGCERQILNIPQYTIYLQHSYMAAQHQHYSIFQSYQHSMYMHQGSAIIMFCVPHLFNLQHTFRLQPGIFDTFHSYIPNIVQNHLSANVQPNLVLNFFLNEVAPVQNNLQQNQSNSVIQQSHPLSSAQNYSTEQELDTSTNVFNPITTHQTRLNERKQQNNMPDKNLNQTSDNIPEKENVVAE